MTVPLIGFMQGRLCAPVDGRIQAFPWRDWEDEFETASRLGFPLMEWTLDLERLDENPLLTPAGQSRIGNLTAEYGVQVGSLTGDCLMEAPFFKAGPEDRPVRLRELDAVIEACARLGIQHLVIPLVDAGRVTSEAEADDLVNTFLARAEHLKVQGVHVAFESDFPPQQLAAFIARLPAPVFGINYDAGNSASLGYNPSEEIATYGERITNVHIKDRLLGGTTVPLGEGALDLPRVAAALQRVGYTGNLILQTARAANDDHAGVLERYRAYTEAAWAVASLGP